MSYHPPDSEPKLEVDWGAVSSQDRPPPSGFPQADQPQPSHRNSVTAQPRPRAPQVPAPSPSQQAPYGVSTFSPLAYYALFAVSACFFIMGGCLLVFMPPGTSMRLFGSFALVIGGGVVIRIARRYRAEKEAEERMWRVASHQLRSQPGEGVRSSAKPPPKSRIGSIVLLAVTIAVGAWIFTGTEQSPKERDCDLLVASMNKLNRSARVDGEDTLARVAGLELSDLDVAALADEYGTVRDGLRQERPDAHEALREFETRLDSICPEAVASNRWGGQPWVNEVLNPE